MKGRDWKKDWELCEKATPGPWEAYYDRFDGHVIRMATALANDEDEKGCEPQHEIEYNHSCVFGDEQFKEALANVQFITEAREALPYWLQQVKQLREKLAYMRQALEEALDDLQTWHSESFAYQTKNGDLAYEYCGGCHTCQVTIPLIEKALELVNRKE